VAKLSLFRSTECRGNREVRDESWGCEIMTFVRLLECATHGSRKWQGHVVCDGCGRVYQTSDDKKPRFAPMTCVCGAALMPPASEQIGDKLGLTIGGTVLVDDESSVTAHATYDSVDWMARPICYLCFRKFTKHHGGAVPNWNSRARKEGN
jgi:hypothetical protein